MNHPIGQGSALERTAYIEECQRSVDRVRIEQLQADAAYVAFQDGVNALVATMQSDTSRLLLLMWGDTFIQGSA